MNKTLFIRSLLVLLGFIFSLKLALTLYISLDEFTYTHAAWLVSLGKIPYRDFPLFHPPLLEFLLSPIFLITQSSFLAILLARTTFALLLLGTALLVKRESNSQIGFFLTICLGVFSTWMTEIRPDSLALFLFLLANFFLSKRHFICSAILLSLAFFCSEKALVYAPALIAPLALQRNVKDILKVVLISLLSTFTLYSFLIWLAGSESVYEFLINWAFKHETLYPRRNLYNELKEYFPQLIFLAAFSGLAIAHNIKSNIQWLTLLILGSCSYFFQRAPYGYSLLPALLALLILASTGLAHIAAGRLSKVQIELIIAIILLAFVAVAPIGEVTNQKQLSALVLVDSKVPIDSCIYDNSGFAVTRHHAGYWYFSDQLIRDTYMKKFETEIPNEVQSKNCTAMVVDERFNKLSPTLKVKLESIFPVCEGLICYRINNFVK